LETTSVAAICPTGKPVAYAWPITAAFAGQPQVLALRNHAVPQSWPNAPLPDAALLAAQGESELELEQATLSVQMENLDTRTRELFAASKQAADRIAAVGGGESAARIEERRQTKLLEIEDKARHHLRPRVGIAAADRGTAGIPRPAPQLDDDPSLGLVQDYQLRRLSRGTAPSRTGTATFWWRWAPRAAPSWLLTCPGDLPDAPRPPSCDSGTDGPERSHIHWPQRDRDLRYACRTRGRRKRPNGGRRESNPRWAARCDSSLVDH
jgi:hypothetical protein